MPIFFSSVDTDKLSYANKEPHSTPIIMQDTLIINLVGFKIVGETGVNRSGRNLSKDKWT